MSNTFKDRLEIALAARNMKAVDLAEKTGINKARISQYVNGIYTPKSKATYLIAQALNVDEKWLMGFDVPMEKTESVQNSAPAPLLTDREVTVALAYRNHPAEQTAVDRILEIDWEEYETVRAASRSATDKPIEDMKVEKSKIRAALADDSIKDDSDL